MDAFKSFSFESGWRCDVAVRDGRMLFELTKGGTRLRAFCQDRLGNGENAARPFAGRALLLGGRIGVEEGEDSLTLHACPVDERTKAPVASLMAHYRLEKAGENALRVTTWFSARRSMPVSSMEWLQLRLERDALRECVGVEPAWRVPVEGISHPARFDAAALWTGNAYLMLSDCGGARFVPSVEGPEATLWADQATGAWCALQAGANCPRGLSGEPFMRDEAHPLSAVLSFGEGEPALPVARALRAPRAKAPEGELLRLASGKLCMGVRVRADGVSMLGVSLEDASCRTEWAGFPLARVLVRQLSSGEVFSLTSEQGWERVRTRCTPNRLSVYLERPRGIDLCLSVEGRAAEEDGIEWRVRVLNQSDDHTVLSVTYPGVSFVSDGAASLFVPSASGRVIEEACAKEAGFSGIYPSDFEGVVPVLGAYAARGGVSRGLYAAVHDASAARKELLCETFRDGSGYFCFDYPAENLGRPRNSFEAGGCLTVRALCGDWYDMAKIYKAFVEQCAPWCPPLGREDSPAWMRDVPMYVMDWMPNDNPDADPVPISIRPPVEPPRDNWYKKPIELAEYLGLPIGYHLYNWHWIPFNNDFPHYFPVKEGLEEGVREMHRHGVHVMPYINGRIADTRDSRGETVRFDRELRPGATKRMDGTLDIETYASHEPDGSLCRLAAMCPTSPAWRDTMARTVHSLFHEYHMDAVYVDQVAAARSNLCCDPTHDHTPGNGDWWVKGYRLLMERLRRECPEGCGFTTESNAETYADQFDGYLTWAWVYSSMVPFFPKVYAGRIALLGRNTNGYKKDDAQFFRFHVGQAVLFGQQIGWINADVVDDDRKNDYLKRMCRMRWELKEFFTMGEMLRPPVITEGQRAYLSDTSMGMDEIHPAPERLAALWRQGGRVLLALTNTSDEAAEICAVYDAAECRPGRLLEARAYGDCEYMAEEPGVLRAKMGARSALAMIWEEER